MPGLGRAANAKEIHCQTSGISAGIHAGPSKPRALEVAVPGPAIEKNFTPLANKLGSCISIG